MKLHLSNFIFGTDNRLSGLIALAFVLSVALGCGNLGKNNNGSTNSSNAVAEDTGDMPGEDLLNALVKETTADFAYAISTEDFSKMYEKEGFVAYAGVPLIAKGEIKGVMEVYHRSPHEPELE